MATTIVVSHTESVQNLGRDSTGLGPAVTPTSGQVSNQQGDTKDSSELSQGSNYPSSSRPSSQLEPKQKQRDMGKGHPSVSDGANASTVPSEQVNHGGSANMKKRPRANSDPQKPAQIAARVSTTETSARAKKKKKR